MTSDAPTGGATATAPAVGDDTPVTGDGEPRTGGRARLSVPLLPALSVLLVLLLAGVAFLWFTRPDESPVRTGDYGAALQAARSGVVDLTSQTRSMVAVSSWVALPALGSTR